MSSAELAPSPDFWPVTQPHPVATRTETHKYVNIFDSTSSRICLLYIKPLFVHV